MKNSVLADRISDLIAATGKTLREIEAETGLSYTALSNYQNNKQTPSATVVCLLADYFDVTSDYLLGRTNDPSAHPAATDELGLSAEAIQYIKRGFNTKPAPGFIRDYAYRTGNSVNPIIDIDDERSLLNYLERLDRLECSPEFLQFVDTKKLLCEILQDECFAHLIPLWRYSMLHRYNKINYSKKNKAFSKSPLFKEIEELVENHGYSLRYSVENYEDLLSEAIGIMLDGIHMKMATFFDFHQGIVPYSRVDACEFDSADNCWVDPDYSDISADIESLRHMTQEAQNG